MSDVQAEPAVSGASGLGRHLLAVFDLRSALFGTLVMGSAVWTINMVATSPPDLLGSTTAALKQGAFTFIFGGLVMRLAAIMAVRPGRPAMVIASAILVPGSITVGMNYFVHCLRGTPSPFLSTIPALALSTVFYPIWVAYHRRKARSPNDLLAFGAGRR